MRKHLLTTVTLATLLFAGGFAMAQQLTVGTGQSSAASANVSTSNAASFVAGVGPTFGVAASTNTSNGASGQASQATIGAGQGTSATTGFNQTHSAGAATQLSLGTNAIGAAVQSGGAQGANTGSAATQFFTVKLTPDPRALAGRTSGGNQMQSCAVLAGGFLLLATGLASAQGVNGSSVNITGGASPAVSSNSTVSGTTASTSTSAPTIIVRPKTRATARGGTGQAVGNQVQIVQEGYTGGGSGGGTPGPSTSNLNTNYSGSYTQTLRNTPEIVAPSVNGGANGCAVGLSGGLSVAGFGITTGAGWSDPDCERRQLAALTYNMNEHDLAAEILCDSKEVRAARLRMGKPCIVDQAPAAITVGAADTQRVDPAILRRQQDTLASQQPVPASGPVISASVIHNGKPDWCETASPQELRAHRECDP